MDNFEKNAMVSVIIPVYNTEKYILECLESVYAQSYDNFEVIIIDDGSTDKSTEIINNFILDKPNFKLIKKQNGGISSARNAGIAESKGEWLTFVDSDDFLKKDFLSNLMGKLKDYPADFCMSGFQKFLEDTKEYKKSVDPQFQYLTRDQMLYHVFFPAPFARLFSRRIILENNLCFDEKVILGEDRTFNFDYLSYVERCLIVEGESYIYRIRPNSMTTGDFNVATKKHAYNHVKILWNSFEDRSIVENAFVECHHFAHNVLDCLLAETINAILESDKTLLNELMNDPISVFILKNYRHKKAPKKEKLLVFLLSHRLYLIAKTIVHIYYNKRIYKKARKIVNRYKTQ